MAATSHAPRLDVELVASDGVEPTEPAPSITEGSAEVASSNDPFEASEAAIDAGRQISHARFNNVLIQGVMTVLIGGILLVLAGVIITDFVEIMPEGTEEDPAFIEPETLTDPLSTALGLAAIALVVPIVAGVVALLMGSFGGFMGGGGMGGNGGGRYRR